MNYGTYFTLPRGPREILVIGPADSDPQGVPDPVVYATCEDPTAANLIVVLLNQRYEKARADLRS